MIVLLILNSLKYKLRMRKLAQLAIHRETYRLLELPEDLLIKVCQYSDMSTIKKLRLACKTLKCAGTAFISKLVLADPHGTITKPQLEAFLQSATGLISLFLSIQTKDQLLMLDADGVMGVLTGLDVNVISLRTSGRRAIVPYLGRASNLQSLCLSSNKAALPIRLGRLLSACSGLRRLCVVDVDLDARDATALLTASHLTALNVGCTPESHRAGGFCLLGPGTSGKSWAPDCHR
eukprot:jgi/Botrbrau1/22490/Bobra.114_2s0016.1